MRKALTLVQVMGYSTPLIQIDFASTGASPVMVIRLLLVVMLSGTVILKLVASSAASWVRMLERAAEMKVLTPAEPGSVAAMPLSRMALNLASRTGSTLLARQGALP